MLQGSRREALLAVDLHNRAASERGLEGYVVHMHMAWLYLHHAKFLRDNVDYRYREPDGRVFVRVDGEIKTWELGRCLREAFPSEKGRYCCFRGWGERVRAGVAPSPGCRQAAP